MRTSLFILLGSIMIGLAGCKKKIEVPGCIQAKIEEVKNSPAHIKAVKEYVFRNMTVYVFVSEPYPDASSTIYDQNCNVVCWLGGIAGNITCQGENFGEKATFLRTVWKK